VISRFCPDDGDDSRTGGVDNDVVDIAAAETDARAKEAGPCCDDANAILEASIDDMVAAEAPVVVEEAEGR